ncbi:hypothetical protein [Caulobacter sp.]|jgi:hypothetical protein|uniref:hypothetical protein n=1 Tax=Caulobacter sp. TaxID=78 RepID=UPI0016162E77
MGFKHRLPQDPGRTHQAPEYTEDEISEVVEALAANAPDLLDVLRRDPATTPMSDYDDAYDRMLTYLFERGYIHTHIEMAMLFKAVRERVGG